MEMCRKSIILAPAKPCIFFPPRFEIKAPLALARWEGLLPKSPQLVRAWFGPACLTPYSPWPSQPESDSQQMTLWVWVERTKWPDWRTTVNVKSAEAWWRWRTGTATASCDRRWHGCSWAQGYVGNLDWCMKSWGKYMGKVSLCQLRKNSKIPTTCNN